MPIMTTIDTNIHTTISQLSAGSTTVHHTSCVSSTTTCVSSITLSSQGVLIYDVCMMIIEEWLETKSLWVIVDY